jgi:hypothetical protein
MRRKIFFHTFWIDKIFFFYEKQKNFRFHKIIIIITSTDPHNSQSMRYLQKNSHLTSHTTRASKRVTRSAMYIIWDKLLIICQPNLMQLKNQNASTKHIQPNFNDPMLQRATKTKLLQKWASCTNYFQMMQIYISYSYAKNTALQLLFHVSCLLCFFL